MTQSEKELLLKDLCARLPYGVKFSDDEGNTINVVGIHKDAIIIPYAGITQTIQIDGCKPYLFPLSSMTEEQYYELQNVSGEDCLDHMEMIKSLRECTDFTHWPLYEYRVIDWFHKNHFDYRGLIPMGLANDATGLNIY